MDTETNVAPAATVIPMPEIPDNTGARPISVDQAAKAMSDWREKQAQPPAEDKSRERTPDGKFAPRQESPAQAQHAAPLQEATGETQEGDPAEVPPLELPRSWSKDKAEQWNSLPRDVQEYLIEHDKTSSAELRRIQNEAAEKSKGLTAKEEAAETARQQHESAAQNVLQILQQQMAGEFSDIKSLDDVRKLAEADPFRFAQFQARQMQLTAQAQEVERLSYQRQQEAQDKFKTWSKEQDSIFEKQFPEFADKEKAGPLRKGITDYLIQEVGVKEETLPRLWDTDLFRDAMFQRVVYDASRFHAAQQKAKAAVQVPKPAPQRPGTTQKGSPHQEAIAAAHERLMNSKGNASIEAAASFMAARRKAAAR